MKFLFLEPFFGGSHRDFAEGLTAHSRHSIDLLTLPARFWKWRMRGAALHFFRHLQDQDLAVYDGLIATNLMSLSDFKALTAPGCLPTLVYFHENQLTYPLAPGEQMDYHFGFTDITSALAADRVRFNSRTHFDAFFSMLPGFLDKMPEFHPKWVVESIRSKAEVLYPGCRFPAQPELLSTPDERPPLIIWNHRWEFDKGPHDFFTALETVARQGCTFRLALLGENFRVIPPVFNEARDRFRDRIVCFGYETSRDRYVDWLRQGAIVISTALQENFGISIVEAVRHGCLPLVPARLVYPEVIPPTFHANFLYRNQEELVEKLALMLRNYRVLWPYREPLSRAMGTYAWETRIPAYDRELAQLARIAD